MSDPLATVRLALERLSVGELQAIGAATYAKPAVAPGLLAWIEMSTDWELHRRRGIDLPLCGPDNAIDPKEDADSVAVAIGLRQVFASDGANVVAFFDAVVGLLTGVGQRQ